MKKKRDNIKRNFLIGAIGLFVISLIILVVSMIPSLTGNATETSFITGNSIFDWIMRLFGGGDESRGEVLMEPGNNIYISQSKTGYGSSCESANSVDWFNDASGWGEETLLIGPGDTVHLCGTISSPLTVQGSGQEENPITIFFEPGAKISNETWPDGTKLIYSSGKNNIVIDGGVNGIIEATDTGTPYGTIYQMNETHGVTVPKELTFNYSNLIYGILVYDSSNWEIRNLTIRNLYQRVPDTNDTIDAGYGIIFANASHTYIHNNNLSKGRVGIAVNPSGGSENEDVKISNNVVSNYGSHISVVCSSTIGKMKNLEISNNTIGTSERFMWDGCWGACAASSEHFHGRGIHVAAGNTPNTITNISIHHNFFYGDLGKYFTGTIFLEGDNNNVDVHHNAFYFDFTDPQMAPANGYIITGYNSRIANVHHNTIIGQGIKIAVYEMDTVKNNILVGTSVPSSGIRISPLGLGVGDISHNLYYNVTEWSRDPSIGGQWYTLDSWKNSSGNPDGIGSFIAEPMFVNRGNPLGPDGIPFTGDDGLQLQAGSPAIGADSDGKTVGAYEYQGDVCGNGNVGSGEECDDANLVSGDGCSSVCVIEIVADGENPSRGGSPGRSSGGGIPPKVNLTNNTINQNGNGQVNNIPNVRNVSGGNVTSGEDDRKDVPEKITIIGVVIFWGTIVVLLGIIGYLGYALVIRVRKLRGKV